MGYIPALDGLRGIAILLVLAFHDAPLLVSGGFVGVDIFFTLSGFLITGLLLSEWQRKGGIDIRAFYGRRALRLLPALFVVIAFTLIATILLMPFGAQLNLPTVAASVFYVANWVDMGSKVGVYQNLGMLNHIWSLSIEEQFYVLWPVFLLTLLRFRHKVPPLATIAGGVICAVVVYRAFLFMMGADEARLYRGTDTRADALLVGCLLAILVHNGQLARIVGERSLRIMVAASIIFFVCLALFSHVYDAFYALGGYTLVAIATTSLLASIQLHPEGILARALSMRPLAGLGKVSYGVYLWHVPIFFLFKASQSYDGDIALHLLRFGVVTVAVLLTYRYIEQPFLRLKGRASQGQLVSAAAPAIAVD